MVKVVTRRCLGRVKAKDDKVLYRLSPAIFFSGFEDVVYLRDVDRCTDMLLSDSTSTLLNALRTPRTITDLARILANKYAIKSNAKVKSDVTQFVASLVESGVVVREGGRCVKSEGIESRIRSLSANSKRLWAVTLELTCRCNEKCIHCYLDNPKEMEKREELQVGDWKRVIDQCYELGCFKVLITGGEPTLHPDFLTICRYVIGKGMLLDIYSNGLSIKDSIIDELIGLKFNSFSVSLYGSSDFHDQVTQVKGSYDRTMRTAMTLKCAGKDVYVKAVLFRGHLKDYFELKKICGRLGIKVNPSTALLPGRSGCAKKSLALSDSELVEFARRESVENCMADYVGRVADGPVCMAGQNQLAINPYGEVYPCVALPIPVGNVRVDAVSKIWGKSKSLKEIQAVRLEDVGKTCRCCKDLHACSVCMGTVLKQNKGGIKIVNAKYACRRVHLQSNKERKER